MIRLAEMRDIPSLVALVNRAYRGETSKIGWTTEAHLLDGIRANEKTMQEILEKPGSVVLLAEAENGYIEGCVNLQEQGHNLYLGMLTVEPALQARGMGKRLLAAAEEYAREKNKQAIRMTVISIRSELISWYERHGYRKTGETRPFPEDPEFGVPRLPLVFEVLEKKVNQSLNG